MPSIIRLEPNSAWALNGAGDVYITRENQGTPEALRIYLTRNWNESTCAFILSDVSAPRDTVRRQFNNYPNLTNSVWHGDGPDAAIPDIGVWVGTYYPAALGPNGNTWINGPAIQCAHCAAVAAVAWVATHPGHTWTVVSTPDNRAPTVYARPCGELVGEELDWATVKSAEIELPERACSVCLMPGHNSASCTQSERFIDRIGIEIEGRWRDVPVGRTNAYDMLSRACHAHSANLGSDGSVHRHSGFFSAEIQTNPGSPREAVRALVDLYPDETGADCGMHVHVSFQDPTLVSTLNTRQFYSYFRQKWVEFIAAHNLAPSGQLAQRLQSRNDYTQLNADTEDQQERFGRVDRYRQINFAAWHEHKTVEFRLLPMFRHARIGVAAVWHLVSLLNEWFSTAGAVLPPFADVTAELSPGENPLEGVGDVVTIPVVDDDVAAPFVLDLIAQEGVTEPGPVLEGHERVALTKAQLETLQALFPQIRRVA